MTEVIDTRKFVTSVDREEGVGGWKKRTYLCRRLRCHALAHPKLYISIYLSV